MGVKEIGQRCSPKFGALAPGRTELPLMGLEDTRRAGWATVRSWDVAELGGKHARPSRLGVWEAGVLGAAAAQSREPPPEGEHAASHSPLLGGEDAGRAGLVSSHDPRGLQAPHLGAR